MADFIIKPVTGDNLKIQDEAGNNAIQVMASADTIIGAPSGQDLVLQPTLGDIIFKDDQGTERLNIAASTGLTHFSNMSGLFNYGITERNGTATATGTTVTVDLATGNFFAVDFTGLSGDVTTFTMLNTSQTAGQVSSFVLKVTQDGTLSKNFTWASISAIDWSGGAGPDISTPTGIDLLAFHTYDLGTKWYGMTIGQDFS